MVPAVAGLSLVQGSSSEVQLKYKVRQSIISQADILGKEYKICLACETRQSNTIYIQETVPEDLDCH